MKLRVGLVIIAVLLVLVGCGNNGQTNGKNDSGTKNDVVTLEWMMWSDNESEAKVWQEMADEVNEIYPHIEIELTTLAFSDYWTRLQTRVAGGTAPDIISMQSLRMPGFGSVLYPLDEFIENDDEIDIEDFDENILENMRYDEQVAALPYDVGPYVMYYNKDLFDAHGVDYPEAGWTMEEFNETIEALSQGEDYGIILKNNSLENYIPFIYSNGGEYLNEDGQYQLNSEATIKTMDQLSQFVANGQAPELVSQSAGNWQAEQWLNGNIGLLLDGPWNILWFLGETTFDFGLIPVPESSEGSVTVSAGSGFGVSADTDYPEEAYQAVKLFTNKANLNHLAEIGRAFPARLSAVEAFYGNVPDEFQTTLDYALDNTVPFEVTNTWNRAQDIFTANLVPIMNGMMSAEDGMNKLQQELENIEE